MNPYTVAWLVIAGVFVVVESLAILDPRKGDTLSEHVWAWIRLRSPAMTTGERIGMWVTRLALLAFLLWLTPHLLFGWPGTFPDLW